jgi:hypothetical protein
MIVFVLLFNKIFYSNGRWKKNVPTHCHGWYMKKCIEHDDDTCGINSLISRSLGSVF